MELLTKSGWQPTNQMESVLVSIRSEMIAGGARLDGTNTVYSEAEAREAFYRVAKQHGWE
jgi:ubiquitin-conjugating enzyme E2 Q